jgi:Putative Actinobacterial Holin-X, holin superfamily III
MTDEGISSADWPSLITRVFHDLARIVQTEIRLFQAGLEPILSSTLDRCLVGMAALMAFAASGICLLAAIIILLSRWLGWPGAFAVGAGMSSMAGLIGLRWAKTRADKVMSRLERSFDQTLEPAQRST